MDSLSPAANERIAARKERARLFRDGTEDELKAAFASANANEDAARNESEHLQQELVEYQDNIAMLQGKLAVVRQSAEKDAQKMQEMAVRAKLQDELLHARNELLRARDDEISRLKIAAAQLNSNLESKQASERALQDKEAGRLKKKAEREQMRREAERKETEPKKLKRGT